MSDRTQSSCECGSTTNSCCGDRTNKMCTLTKPHHNFDVEKIKKLVDNPRFLCKCCGRLANKEESLCSPTPLNL